MGMWFSFPSENKENSSSAKVLPESTKSESGKILIRHRPTCLSTDLEKGVTDGSENAPVDDTISA